MAKLNEQQTQAVHHPLGEPAVVIAGAGSGKTTVMTARVKWLAEEQGVPLREILVITFTNKAAGELNHRLGISEDSVDKPQVGTIHSLALSFIRRDPRGFGLGFKILTLDEYDQTKMLDEILEKMGVKDSIKSYPLKLKIGYHRARGIGFRVDYTDIIHQEALTQYGGIQALTEPELEAWSRYEQAKTRQGLIDFDDMIHLVVRRMRTDEEWKSRVSKHYKHILMDEAQDTNVVQWEFVNGLFEAGNLNAYVVGDLSQSIYGFAGASPASLFEFSQSWKGVTPRVYKIERNHRSVPEVVGLANRIQKNMSETIPLKMISWRGENGEKGSTGLMLGLDQMTLAAEIAQSIQKERARLPYRDVAILFRSNSQVKDLEVELVKRKIPYVIRGTKGFLQSAEVRDLLAYLRIVVNPKDQVGFKRAAQVPKRGVGEVTLDKIVTEAEKGDGDLLAACERTGKLLLFTQMIRRISGQVTKPSEGLDIILKETGYEKYLREGKKKDPMKLEYQMTNIQRLRETLETLESDLGIEDILFQLSMNGEKEQETPEGKVVVSTIHSSKGLEWKKVYLYGAVEGLIPHKFSQGEKEVEEERRLFYVACTRAKDHLVIGVPSQLETPYSTTRVAPSRFLTELGLLRGQAPL